MSELVIRWVWTILACLGAGYSVWNVLDAIKDREAVHVSKTNGVLLVTAEGNIRREVVRLLFWSIAISVGVASLFRVESEWLAYALLLFAALNVFNSRQDGHERRQIRRLTEGENHA